MSTVQINAGLVNDPCNFIATRWCCILNWYFEGFAMDGGFIDSVPKCRVELSDVYRVVREEWAVLCWTQWLVTLLPWGSVPPGVRAQLLLKVQQSRAGVWELAADKVGNPTCTHPVPLFCISWIWFSSKPLVNWKLFMGFAGLVHSIVSQSIWNLDWSCVREVPRAYTREKRDRKLLNCQLCLSTLSKCSKTKQPTWCNWEVCGRRENIYCIAANT